MTESPVNNGNDTVSLSITKQQSETAVSVSNAVKKTIANLEGADENLHIITVRDDADSIISSLKECSPDTGPGDINL